MCALTRHITIVHSRICKSLIDLWHHSQLPGLCAGCYGIVIVGKTALREVRRVSSSDVRLVLDSENSAICARPPGVTGINAVDKRLIRIHRF